MASCGSETQTEHGALLTASGRNAPCKQNESSQSRFPGDLNAAILLQSKYPAHSVQKINELRQAFQL